MVEFSEKKALEILEADEITIDIDMNDGGETAEIGRASCGERV